MGVAQPISSVQSFASVAVIELDDLRRHAKAHVLQHSAGHTCEHCLGVFRARSTFDMHEQRCSARAPLGDQRSSAGAASGQQGLTNEVEARNAKQSAGGADSKLPPELVQSAEQQLAATDGQAASASQGRLAAQLVVQLFTGASSSRAAFAGAFWASLPADWRRQVGKPLSIEHQPAAIFACGRGCRTRLSLISLFFCFRAAHCDRDSAEPARRLTIGLAVAVDRQRHRRRPLELEIGRPRLHAHQAQQQTQAYGEVTTSVSDSCALTENPSRSPRRRLACPIDHSPHPIRHRSA